MKIGVVKEIKDKENRVALTPEGARHLIKEGHTILLEENAGVGSGFSNEQYSSLGVEIVSASVAWDTDLVIKIKEPLEQEYSYLRDNFLFTYLHLSGVPRSLTDALVAANTTAIAYETVEDEHGRLPLLAPMSAVAGNMAITIGSYYLARFNEGKGVQPGKVIGKIQGKIMVIGTGMVGQHAAFTADGMGTNVYIFGRNKQRFDELEKPVNCRINFVQSTPETIAEHITDTDVVVGGVLVAGARAPHVVTEEMVKLMQPGSVIVDVSIDQGGCVATSRPTSHSDPVFTEHGVIHYCVTNMPGAYPRTSTIALTSATLPYISRLANQGLEALEQDRGFSKGVNTCQGLITCQPVADALELNNLYKDFTDI